MVCFYLVCYTCNKIELSVEFSIKSANHEPRKKKSSSREIRITLHKKQEHDPDFQHYLDCSAADIIPGTSNIEVEPTGSFIQRVELDTTQLDSASEVTRAVAGAAGGVGDALDTAEKLVTFKRDFLKKCQFLSDRLGFIVGAVDKIAEVRSFCLSCSSSVRDDNPSLDSSLRKVGVECDLLNP